MCAPATIFGPSWAFRTYLISDLWPFGLPEFSEFIRILGLLSNIRPSGLLKILGFSRITDLSQIPETVEGFSLGRHAPTGES